MHQVEQRGDELEDVQDLQVGLEVDLQSHDVLVDVQQLEQPEQAEDTQLCVDHLG